MSGSDVDSILVLGAGVFGAAAALELRRRGHAVTLVDPGPIPHPAASSTDISKVIRMDYGADAFYMALMEEAFRGWDAWNREWPEPLYHETGFLIMSPEEMRPGGFEYETFTLLESRGHHPQRLDAAALNARFPLWNAERYRDGYYNPRAGWAESGRVVARLVEMARETGVVMQEGVRTAALLEEGSRVAGIVTEDGRRLRANCVVAAAGAWTPVLIPHLRGLMAPIGQPVLHFRVDPALFAAERFPVWAADIARTGWYGFPAQKDGTLKVANHGRGREIHPDAPRSIDPGDEPRFRAFLRGTFPAAADAPLIAGRLCLYCDTWDGDFYIDHDPERPGLVVATGGSGHGFKFAPVLGPIIADVVERRENPWAARFAWRQRGAGRSWEPARNMGEPGA